ncbi:hypothetical protein BpHYR1_010041 [Brachionus plicatilis]|uniref:Uncharacterized protein n=1 Tax=Brachionus plicatilis TaxID=10195 RepID=A0A3M7R973_BRAPC|nr:hypothetical protein BpHYR1_010041 [Brachionus plicatilis]
MSEWVHVAYFALWIDDLVERVVVQVVDELAVVLVQIGPDTERSLVRVFAGPLQVGVAQKSAEQTRVGVVAELEQKCFVELESGRVLAHYLVDAVEPLEKDGTTFVGVVGGGRVAVALRELVAELEPVDFDESAEAGDGAVVGVEQQLGQGEDLGRAVPAVRAVHEHRLAVLVGGAGDRDGRLDYAGQVVQPFSGLELAQKLPVVGQREAEEAERVEAGADHVDVLEVHELDFAVGVVLGVLVAAALDPVGERYRAKAGVYDEQEGPVGRLRLARVRHRSEQQLVLVEAPGEQAHVRLGGAGEHGAVLAAAPRHRRKALRAPEAGHFFQLLVRFTSELMRCDHTNAFSAELKMKN